MEKVKLVSFWIVSTVILLSPIAVFYGVDACCNCLYRQVTRDDNKLEVYNQPACGIFVKRKEWLKK